MLRRGVGALVVAALLGVAAAEARATTLDLTTDGSQGWVNGAFFKQIDPQPTGTGYIDPFVRIQAHGTEQGYNTDGRPFQWDEKEPVNYEHALNLADTGVVTLDGVSYRVFMLDINEPNGVQAGLTLDEVQVVLGSGAKFVQFDVATGSFLDPGAVSTRVWDMDGAGDSTVLLNYDLNSGSGAGDILLYVPDALFPRTDATPYLYLYSHFGAGGGTWGSADGFEEWWYVKGTTPPPVPEPGTLVLLGLGVAGVVARARRRGCK